MQPSYPEFRKRLDAVLRQRDPAALRAFLIAEGQWDAETTTDPERAMWMMIATSPALAPLHADALTWLSVHGYQEEAQALGGRRGESGGPTGQPDRGSRRPHPPDGRRQGPRRSPHRHPDRPQPS